MNSLGLGASVMRSLEGPCLHGRGPLHGVGDRRRYSNEKSTTTFRQERDEATADTFNHLPSRFAQPEVTALCIEISFPPMVARASTM